MHAAIINSPLGKLGIQITENVLTKIDFVEGSARLKAADNDVAQNVIAQLENYFNNPHAAFTIPLIIHGTAYQQRVWKVMRSIPVGATLTYGAIAQQLNSSPRSVGNACRHNPIPIIIPCHRVIAVNGIGGYSGKTAGEMMTIKRWLLQHEQAHHA